MRKITCLEISFIFLLFFALLGFPILAGAQVFNYQEQAVSPQPGQVEQKVCDPYERSNRKIFHFNDRLYTCVLTPITTEYKKLPYPVRKAIRNGFDNLEVPAYFVNFVLQGRPQRAGNEMTRFVINSTVGVGGMFDVAQNACGIQDHAADFGETLGLWGVQPGAYLVVPALGPSDERDLVGFAVDIAMDPLVWIPGPWWISIPPDALKYTSEASDNIDSYEAMKKAALDPYVSMRNAYLQHREHVISGR